MIKVICDRCESETEVKHIDVKLTIGSEPWQRSTDLCSVCLRAFKDNLIQAVDEKMR